MLPTDVVRDEVDQKNLIEGKIPSVVFEVAAAQKISAEDIWGVYLAPDDPRNPNLGSHYLGMQTVGYEQLKEQIEKEQNVSDLADGQDKWVEVLLKLGQRSEKNLKIVTNEGQQAIKTHELTHKEQWEKYGYQTEIVSAFEKLSQLSPENRGDVRRSYQDLILLAEVQALSAQCARRSDHPQEQRMFNTYWFSKTYRLLNQKDIQKYAPVNVSMDDSGKVHIEYGSKKIEQLESLYLSLRNHSEYSKNISNVNGLLSRALYVCEDPVGTLRDIRYGAINYLEFRKRVTDGLNIFLTQDTQSFSKRAELVKESLEEPIENEVNKLREL